MLASDAALSRAVCGALERSDDVVILAEAHGVAMRIVAANAEAQRLTGYARHELQGQDFTLLSGPDTDGGVPRPWGAGLIARTCRSDPRRSHAP